MYNIEIELKEAVIIHWWRLFLIQIWDTGTREPYIKVRIYSIMSSILSLYRTSLLASRLPGHHSNQVVYLLSSPSCILWKHWSSQQQKYELKDINCITFKPQDIVHNFNISLQSINGYTDYITSDVNKLLYKLCLQWPFLSSLKIERKVKNERLAFSYKWYNFWKDTSDSFHWVQ